MFDTIMHVKTDKMEQNYFHNAVERAQDNVISWVSQF